MGARCAEGLSKKSKSRATAVVRHKATVQRQLAWHSNRGKACACSFKLMPGGRSEIQASKGSDMLRSPSIQIKANH